MSLAYGIVAGFRQAWLHTNGETVRGMIELTDRGFSTFDVSLYDAPAANFAGEFRRSVRRTAANECQFLVWMGGTGRGVSRKAIEGIVDDMLGKLGVERLDLVQYESGEYSGDACIEALGHLMDLCDEAKVRCLGVSNFDTRTLRRAVNQGIQVVSNQVGHSVVDLRPREEMEHFCEQNGIMLITYGTLCGGLLSDRCIGLPKPTRRALDTPSLVQYKALIDTWGGWGLLQEPLFALRTIVEKHQVSVANLATRWVLQQKSIGAIIIGARLGMNEERNHMDDNARVFEFELDTEDLV